MGAAVAAGPLPHRCLSRGAAVTDTLALRPKSTGCMFHPGRLCWTCAASVNTAPTPGPPAPTSASRP